VRQNHPALKNSGGKIGYSFSNRLLVHTKSNQLSDVSSLLQWPVRHLTQGCISESISASGTIFFVWFIFNFKREGNGFIDYSICRSRVSRRGPGGRFNIYLLMLLSITRRVPCRRPKGDRKFGWPPEKMSYIYSST
jgi:hypothetical protein